MKKVIAWIVGIGCLVWIPGAMNAAWAIPCNGTCTTYDLTSGNTAISGYTTNAYATVTVDLNSTGTIATITFTGGTGTGASANDIFLMGDGGAVALNVNASSFTVGTVTGTAATGTTNFSPGPYSTNIKAGQAENGFGKFNLTIDSSSNGNNGYQGAAGTITFTITNTSGTPWLTSGAADPTLVLTANGNNALVAAHIFVTTSGADANSGTGALTTGFAANGGAIDNPLPSAFLLFGSVLVGGLGASTWRGRRRSPVSVIA
jgi:hypothetical protein